MGLVHGDRDGAFVEGLLDRQDDVAVDRVRPVGHDDGRHGGALGHPCGIATGGRAPSAPERPDHEQVAVVGLLHERGGEGAGVTPDLDLHVRQTRARGVRDGLGDALARRSDAGFERRVDPDHPDAFDAGPRPRGDPVQGFLVRLRCVRGQRDRRPPFVHPDRPPRPGSSGGVAMALLAVQTTPARQRATTPSPGERP
ncbi:hypothetical protein ACIPC2_16765 [Curtobacterium pusillum]|uniref:hypothetical protein n=1 Tax=Curtobacterium pusillum TaxID=69373 RepID=UPI0037F78A1D